MAAPDALLRYAAATLLFVGCVLVLQPFITAILLAVVISVTAWPANVLARRIARGNATAGALLLIVSAALLLLVPFALAGTALANAAPGWITLARAWMDQSQHPAPAWMASIPVAGAWLVSYWDQLAASQEELTTLGKNLLDPVSGVLLNGGAIVTRGVADLALSLFVSFFFFRDGEALVDAIRASLTRVAGTFAEEVLNITAGTIQGVVLGLLGTAAAQASVALLGFLLVQAPMPWALAAGVGVFSLVPVGPPMLWGGVTVWLVSEGRIPAAIFMGLYGMFGISGIDNIVKPLLISRGAAMPFILVLMGVVGGLLAFGFVGVFLGPVLLAVGYTAVRRWAGLEGA